MITLKQYQEDAINNLFNIVKISIKSGSKKNCVLKSPTGSGKTIIAIKLIEKIINELDGDMCFIWISVSDGKLHTQSYESIKKNLNTSSKITSIDELKYAPVELLENNEVVILSWAGSRTKDKKNEYKNIIMRGGEKISFIETIENTKKVGRKIILFIDECHTNTRSERSIELLQKINADITLEMSATPVMFDSYDLSYKIKYLDCVNAGMLKKYVSFNKNIKQKDIDKEETDSIKTIIHSAYDKRLDIKKEFEKMSLGINPLCLIQIPTRGSDQEQIILEYVTSILKSLGEIENETFIRYLDEDKNTDLIKNIKELNNPINFLIFKNALSVGWDCPRAHILVKLRKINKEEFKIQTFGRIMRMPERKHYNNLILDVAYCFSNVIDPQVKTKDIDKIFNIINCRKKIDTTDLNLWSFYRSETGKRSLQNNFLEFFSEVLVKKYKLKDPTSSEHIENYKYYSNLNIQLLTNSFLENKDKFVERLDTNYKSTPEFFDSGNQEPKFDKSKCKQVTTNQAIIDMDIQINSIFRDLLTGLIPSKSYKLLKESFYIFCQKYLGFSSNILGILKIQRFFLSNTQIFCKIIEECLIEYCKILFIDNPGEFCCWTPSEYTISNKFKINHSYTKYLYLPEAPLDDSKLEYNFFSYINSFESVFWWVKNNIDNKSSFAIRYFKNYIPKAYYVDFIISLNNGIYLLLETKGDPFSEDTKVKMKALSNYIKINEGIPLLGGIVRNRSYTYSNDRWEINYQLDNYNPDKNWISFNDFMSRVSSL